MTVESPDVVVEVYSTRTMTGKKRWRWRAVARNHEIVARGEAYTRREGAKNAIRLLMSPHTSVVVHDKNDHNYTVRQERP